MFKKGHKINKGRKVSLETRMKIGESNRKERVSIECGCCKTIFTVWPSKSNTAKFCSKKCSFEGLKGKTAWNKGLKGYRIGEKRPNVMPKGKEHWSYIQDRSKLVKKQKRNDTAYREWRLEVYKRDNYKCKIGNDDCNGRIEAHHILNWSKFKELRYEVNNGITLCHFHHPRKINDEMKLTPYFKELVLVKNV